MASGNTKRGAVVRVDLSPIWEHFGFRTTEDNGKKIPVSSVTTCKHCFADVSYKSGNTSNMATHMKKASPMHRPASHPTFKTATTGCSQSENVC